MRNTFLYRVPAVPPNGMPAIPPGTVFRFLSMDAGFYDGDFIIESAAVLDLPILETQAEYDGIGTERDIEECIADWKTVPVPPDTKSEAEKILLQLKPLAEQDPAAVHEAIKNVSETLAAQVMQA
jgi:hypothetical protein